MGYTNNAFALLLPFSGMLPMRTSWQDDTNADIHSVPLFSWQHS